MKFAILAIRTRNRITYIKIH